MLGIPDVLWLGSAVGVSALAGAGGMLLLMRRRAAPAARTTLTVITEQVRAVGMLVGLEVRVKEIATATRGWTALPPLILSPARVAMIFHFEKQYAVNLAAVGADDVRDLGGGRFSLRLPAVEGRVRLTDVTPYDIQDGRVLGLLDVIPVNAERQKELMTRAQEQAADVFSAGDRRYSEEARAAVERQVRSLLRLFGVDLEIEWSDDPAGEASPARPGTDPSPEDSLPACAAPRRNRLAGAV